MTSSKSTPSEHAEQAALIAWYDRAYSDKALFAIPNGGQRHAAIGLKMKIEGVRPGVPDCFLPVPTDQYHGLFIEMKRTKGGRVSPEQKAWLEYLNDAGYKAVVCKGFLEAKEVIECYLSTHTSTI